MTEGIGDRFQGETKYFRGKLAAGYLDWKKRPGPYKTYPEASKVKLPAPERSGGMPLWEAVGKRRSVQDFRGTPISAQDLSQILWASQGVTRVMGEYALRSAPSAGALRGQLDSPVPRSPH